MKTHHFLAPGHVMYNKATKKTTCFKKTLSPHAIYSLNTMTEKSQKKDASQKFGVPKFAIKTDVQICGVSLKDGLITLQGINISHLGKRKIIFKMPFWGDMIVPWRVHQFYSIFVATSL